MAKITKHVVIVVKKENGAVIRSEFFEHADSNISAHNCKQRLEEEYDSSYAIITRELG